MCPNGDGRFKNGKTTGMNTYYNNKHLSKVKFIRHTIFFTLLFLGFATLAPAQRKVPSRIPDMKQQQYQAKPLGKITGTVVDEEFNEPLEKAVITIPGTPISVLTDQHGNFHLDLVGGDYFLKINYPGYFEKQYNMSVSSGIMTPMYLIKLKANAVGQTEQRRISSYEIKSQHLQNVENFSTWQITEQMGLPEFNDGLRSIPAVTVFSNGTGYNDSEISFRGNEATHTNYTLDGILLNNPETGKIGQTMLSGLTDWAGKIQVIAGNASSLQSQTNSGGLINVLSFDPHKKTGAEVLAIYGNEGFMKTTATIHSGLSRKGLSSAIQVSRTAGDGISQNTGFEQYSAALKIFKEFNHRHTLIFNFNGVMQQHDCNRADSIGDYNRNSTKYNRDWRTINGKQISWSTNYGRSPLISLTHHWQPQINTCITTELYAQFDRTAQKVPNATSVDPLNWDKNEKFGSLGKLTEGNDGYNLTAVGGTFIQELSKNTLYPEFNGTSNFVTIDNADRYGLRSIINHLINKELDLSASLNLESYHAQHFCSQINLLGEDNYTCLSDINRPSGYTVEKLFQSTIFPTFTTADRVVYSNETSIQTGGISIRLKYQTPGLCGYLEGSGSLKCNQRTDHFSYLVTDPKRKTNEEFIPGGNIQTGFSVNFWKYHSIHLKANYGSYQPLFTTLFPSQNNWKNEQATNEQNLDAEFGYTIFSRKLKVEALAYYSLINNRSLIQRNNLTEQDAFGILSGIDEIHQGVEMKSSYKLTRNLQFNLNGSYGNWTYSNDAKVKLYNTDNQTTREIIAWTKDIRISNTPQVSLFAEAEYRWANNFYVRLNYFRAEQIYAPFNLYDSAKLTERKDSKQWQLPNYQLLGASGNYFVKIRKSLTLNFIFGANNILDTEYIQQTFSNIPEGDSRYTSNQVYYGSGRTWFAGFKIQF